LIQLFLEKPPQAFLAKLDPTKEAVLYSAYRIYSDLSAESTLGLSVVDPNSARDICRVRRVGEFRLAHHRPIQFALSKSLPCRETTVDGKNGEDENGSGGFHGATDFPPTGLLGAPFASVISASDSWPPQCSK
jgi:hypothetical protein